MLTNIITTCIYIYTMSISSHIVTIIYIHLFILFGKRDNPVLTSISALCCSNLPLQTI